MGITKPAAGGDMLSPEDVNGHLLLVIPTEYVPEIATVYNKAGETSRAIRVNVAVLTQQTAEGQHPVYNGVLWFNVRLLDLRKQIGETVLGRMGQGAAKPGQDPPWVLNDATDDAGSLAYAESWLTQHPEFEALAAREIAANSGLSRPAQPPAPAAAPVPSVPTVPAVSLPVQPGTPAPGPAPAVPTPAATIVPTINPAAPALGADVLKGLPPEEIQKLLLQLQQQQQ